MKSMKKRSAFSRFRDVIYNTSDILLAILIILIALALIFWRVNAIMTWSGGQDSDTLWFASSITETKDRILSRLTDKEHNSRQDSAEKDTTEKNQKTSSRDADKAKDSSGDDTSAVSDDTGREPAASDTGEGSTVPSEDSTSAEADAATTEDTLTEDQSSASDGAADSGGTDAADGANTDSTAAAAPTASAAGEKITVTLEKGCTLNEMADKFYEAGLVETPQEFIDAATAAGATSSMKYGTYTFDRGVTPQDIVAALL